MLFGEVRKWIIIFAGLTELQQTECEYEAQQNHGINIQKYWKSPKWRWKQAKCALASGSSNELEKPQIMMILTDLKNDQPVSNNRLWTLQAGITAQKQL